MAIMDRPADIKHDLAPEEVAALFSSAAFTRLKTAPYQALVTDRRREEAIDVFLAALCSGKRPLEASVTAGVMLYYFERWAQEETPHGKVFAMQWAHAEAYIREQKEAAIEDIIVNGVEEYVTCKDGIVYELNLVTGRSEPVKQRRYDTTLMKLWLQANNPDKYATRTASAGAFDLSPADFSEEIPEVLTDEPGPQAPIL